MNLVMKTIINEKEASTFIDRSTQITVGDLFCGMGGWTEGIKSLNYNENTPFKVVWALDNWDRVCDVHKRNHPEVDVVPIDIRDADPSAFEPVDVIVGSPPCPPFSSAKQWQDKDIDAGLELVDAFFRFVNKLKPLAWAMENVKTFKGFIPYIKNLPTDASSFIIKGTDAGVPQNRERCIITNVIEPDYREPNSMSLKDIITKLPLPGDESPGWLRHDLYEVKTEHIGVLYTKKRLKKGAGRVPFPDDLDRAARTICAKPSPVGREPIIIEDWRFRPYKLRYLSIREQAMIQGFRMNYILDEAKSHAQVMVGNAFPPPMAKAVGFEIWKEVRLAKKL